MHACLLRLLSSFYRNLQRWPKYHAGYGQAISATNGIVQGCPISVVLLNMLVCVWCTAISAPDGVQSAACADDTGAQAEDSQALGRALLLTGSFATVTSQELAPKKCHCWATSANLCTEVSRLRLHGAELTTVLVDRVLGAYISFALGRSTGQRVCQLESLQRCTQRAAALPLNAEHRGDVVAATAVNRFVYGAEAAPPADADLRKARTRVLAAVWRGRGLRAPEIVLTLLHAGHRLDPVQASAYKALLGVRELGLKLAGVANTLRTSWLLHQQDGARRVRGPVAAALAALRANGARWEHWNRWQLPGGDVHWMTENLPRLRHAVRELLRIGQWRSLSSRRDSFAGIERGILREATLKLWRKLRRTKPYRAGVLEACMAGAVRTAQHYSKQHGGTEACPFCGTGATETLEHLFWECSAWDALRSAMPDARPPAAAPSCHRLHALAPVRPDLLNWDRGTEDYSETAAPCDYLLETWAGDSVVVWTDGACTDQASETLRCAGYGVVYDPARRHPRTVARPLLGEDQTAQRAELRALLAALLQESRPLQVRSDSQYVVDTFAVLQQRGLDRIQSHRDLWVRVHEAVLARAAPAEVIKVLGHAKTRHVRLGLVSAEDKTRRATTRPTWQPGPVPANMRDTLLGSERLAGLLVKSCVSRN